MSLFSHDDPHGLRALRQILGIADDDAETARILRTTVDMDEPVDEEERDAEIKELAARIPRLMAQGLREPILECVRRMAFLIQGRSPERVEELERQKGILH